MPTERKIVISKAFEKSYKKFASKNESLKKAIAQTLQKLQKDAFDVSLRTHKLSGKLAAYMACSCGYDCRVIFTIEKSLNNPGTEIILLLDIGTHNEVY